MTPVARTRTIAPVMALAVLFLAGSARPAHADITAFLGLSPTPERHFLRGFSGGLSLLIVGFEFEFEFSDLAEDDIDGLPGATWPGWRASSASSIRRKHWLEFNLRTPDERAAPGVRGSHRAR